MHICGGLHNAQTVRCHFTRLMKLPRIYLLPLLRHALRHLMLAPSVVVVLFSPSLARQSPCFRIWHVTCLQKWIVFLHFQIVLPKCCLATLRLDECNLHPAPNSQQRTKAGDLCERLTAHCSCHLQCLLVFLSVVVQLLLKSLFEIQRHLATFATC